MNIMLWVMAMKNIKTALKKDIGILLLDIIAVNLSYFLALVFRAAVDDVGLIFTPAYDFPLYFGVFLRFAPIYTVACIIIFIIFHLYGAVWKFAGINDMYRIIGAWLVTTAVQVLGTMTLMRIMGYQIGRMPYTYYMVGSVLQLLLVSAIRFASRFVLVEKNRRQKKEGKAIIVGAGELGTLTMNVLQSGKNFNVCAIVDTEKERVGLLINGVPVFGIETLDPLLDKNNINCVFLAEPDLSVSDRMMIAAACRKRGIELRERAADSEETVTEEQFVVPTTVMESEWAERYKEQFGEEPSFF